MLSFSLVINTYNRRHFLERALSSLRYLRWPELEVVCVNGPSDDGTDSLLAAWEGRIKTVHCPETNLSLSRNLGIRAAAGDVVCFIDDDAVPEPNWLEGLAPAFEDPETAAAGGFIRDSGGIEYQARYVACDRFSSVYAFERREDMKIDGRGPEDWGREYYTALTGTNCAFRREALERIGGFDETYAYFLDETDVLVRLLDAGGRIVCREGAEVHHKYAPSHLRNEKKIPSSLYYPLRSRAYFAWRHALEFHGFARTHAEIRRHGREAEQGVSWLRSAGDLDEERSRILLDDIDRGLKDGLELAFSLRAPYTRPPSFFAAPPPFKAFPRLSPAPERLKLGLISQDYPPRPNGGIGVWMHELAGGLAARGHEVAVIARAEGEPSVDFENGAWVHRIRQRHLPERPYAAPDNLPQIIYDWSASAYAEARRIALLRGLDLVLAPIWDVEGLVAHCSKSFPVALTLHTSYALAEPSKPLWREIPGYFEGHARPVMEAEKLLLRESPLILANSRAIVADLEKCHSLELNKERVAVVPHGLKEVAAPGEAGEKEGVAVLFVGRFEERKGIDVLLQALPGLAAAHPEAVFQLAGDNGLGSWWRDFSAKYGREAWFSRLYVPGFVGEDELEALYRDCDLFVAPSRYESFGLIYLEAMRWGKPCIGTRAGGIPETLAHAENGLLVTPGSVEELSAAMEKLIMDGELRKKFGRRSKEIFAENFTSERMARGIEDAARSFLKS